MVRDFGEASKVHLELTSPALKQFKTANYVHCFLVYLCW